MDYSFNPKDAINANDRFRIGGEKRKPNIDVAVSKLVGKTILATDSKLIGIITKWKAGKDQYSTQPDDFLNDPDKVKELKEAFA
ncbi:MAG: hypothetical protein IH948_10025 [Bacteroidetes bacterium]|nr:hypothetical protein [Bacteroidota bacterium]